MISLPPVAQNRAAKIMTVLNMFLTCTSSVTVKTIPGERYSLVFPYISKVVAQVWLYPSRRTKPAFPSRSSQVPASITFGETVLTLFQTITINYT